MSVERRFLTGAREESTDQGGLVIDDGGGVFYVQPGGLRQALVVATVVTVTLGAPGAFEMNADLSSVPVGAVTFLVSSPASTHEFLLLQTDDTAAAIVAAAIQGGTVDESQYDVLLDSGDMPAGRHVRFDIFLSAGHYVMLCNEAGHAHLGMAADFTVA